MIFREFELEICRNVILSSTSRKIWIFQGKKLLEILVLSKRNSNVNRFLLFAGDMGCCACNRLTQWNIQHPFPCIEFSTLWQAADSALSGHMENVRKPKTESKKRLGRARRGGGVGCGAAPEVPQKKGDQGVRIMKTGKFMRCSGMMSRKA